MVSPPRDHPAPTAIRSERPGDAGAIGALTAAAFAPVPHSDGAEPRIVENLRRDGDLALSLVATELGGIVGHVAFSPVGLGSGGAGWYGLGPLSVRPDRQRRGIGGALVEAGLSALRARGAAGCVLLGDPGYYGRFGFRGDGAMSYADVPPEYLQYLSFGGAVPSGPVTFSRAFGA